MPIIGSGRLLVSLAIILSYHLNLTTSTAPGAIYVYRPSTDNMLLPPILDITLVHLQTLHKTHASLVVPRCVFLFVRHPREEDETKLMFPLLYEYLQNRGLKVVRVVNPMVTE